jgi:YegS/Rv2252/BmrU family lipid kinase
MTSEDRSLATARPRKALLLLNPNARQGRQNIDGILDRMADEGLAINFETSLGSSELSEAIIKRKNDTDCVIVCGGDGTMNAAARGLMETKLPVGLFPMGTANDLARTLGIPMDLNKAADIIIAGQTNAIDAGSVNGHPFFNVASLGLSAELVRGLTRETKQRWGRLGYALAASRVLMQARPFRAWIANKDERVRVTTLQIAVGNGRYYGGGNVVEATAEIDDGMLDLYSLELKNVAKLAIMLRSFRQGAHGAWDEVRTKRCVEFDIETRTPRPINADGELVTETPAHFKVHRKAVIVYIPSSPQAESCR